MGGMFKVQASALSAPVSASSIPDQAPPPHPSLQLYLIHLLMHWSSTSPPSAQKNGCRGGREDSCVGYGAKFKVKNLLLLHDTGCGQLMYDGLIEALSKVAYTSSRLPF